MRFISGFVVSLFHYEYVLMKHEITERVFPLIQVDNAKHLTRSFGLLLLVFKTQKHKHRYIRRKQRFVRQYIISSSRKEGEK